MIPIHGFMMALSEDATLLSRIGRTEGVTSAAFELINQTPVKLALYRMGYN